MNIAIDIDGVLQNFCLAYGNLLIKETGKDLLPEGWKTDPAFPPEWDWDSHFGYSIAEQKAVWTNHIKSSPDFWKNLQPFEHTRPVIRQLNRLERSGVGVFFITNREGDKVRVQTEEFLYGQGMNYPAVIISSQKMPIIKSLGIEWYLDDRKETMEELIPLGKEHFFLLDTPYNREHDPRLKVVGSVEEALRKANLWKG